MSVVVELRLVSAISRSRDRLLGKVVVANDGTGNRVTGNYNVGAFNGRSTKVRLGRVEAFPRRRSALELLRRALNDLHEKGELP